MEPKYFKSENLYPKQFFEDIGVEIIDFYSKNGMNFYTIIIPETLSGEKAFKFSSIFSIRSHLVSKEEFENTK